MMYPDYSVYPVKVVTLLFRIVASMYNPFSVKAFGNALVFANFVVENFDRKSTNSLSL